MTDESYNQYQTKLNFENLTYLQKRIAKHNQRLEKFGLLDKSCGCGCHLESNENSMCMSCSCDFNAEQQMNSREKLFGESQKALEIEKNSLDHILERNEKADIPEIKKIETRKIIKSAIKEWEIRKKNSETYGLNYNDEKGK